MSFGPNKDGNPTYGSPTLQHWNTIHPHQRRSTYVNDSDGDHHIDGVDDVTTLHPSESTDEDELG